MFLECEPERVHSMLLYFSKTAKGKCVKKDTLSLELRHVEISAEGRRLRTNGTWSFENQKILLVV